MLLPFVSLRWYWFERIFCKVVLCRLQLVVGRDTSVQLEAQGVGCHTQNSRERVSVTTIGDSEVRS